jgi:purine-binding chemotaxis protein CheW
MTQQPHDIDWDAIWRSLNWSDSAQLDNLQERLRQRARQYAEPLPTEASEAEERISALVFRLGNEQYGIPVGYVRSVRPLPRLTRVPGIPAFYRGVVNLRGQIVTVMDLRLFLEIHNEEAAAPGELVIVRADKHRLELGLLAHHVVGVQVIPQRALQASSEVRFALGITAEKVVLLNLEQIFESERLIIGGMDDV